MCIIKVISATRLRGMGHVAHMGEKLTAYSVFTNNLNVRGCYDDVGTDGKLALKYILEVSIKIYLNTLRTESFKLFKRLFPGFLTILTL
jgi:hypothetical protein